MDTLGPKNGARDVVCFDCRNSIRLDSSEAVPRPGGGFYHQFRCRKGLTAPAGGLDSCPESEPNIGFQIDGYYNKMWFEGSEPNGCLEWKICNAGQFLIDEPTIEFHICDFRQLERFVKFWGEHLRRKGLITDGEEDD